MKCCPKVWTYENLATVYADRRRLRHKQATAIGLLLIASGNNGGREHGKCDQQSTTIVDC